MMYAGDETMGDDITSPTFRPLAQHATPAHPVLPSLTYTNVEDGIAAIVTKLAPARFHVALRDTDAGVTFPTSSIYLTEGAAIVAAKLIANICPACDVAGHVTYDCPELRKEMR